MSCTQSMMVLVSIFITMAVSNMHGGELVPSQTSQQASGSSGSWVSPKTLLLLGGLGVITYCTYTQLPGRYRKLDLASFQSSSQQQESKTIFKRWIAAIEDFVSRSRLFLFGANTNATSASLEDGQDGSKANIRKKT